jgi:hypothetical protein
LKRLPERTRQIAGQFVVALFISPFLAFAARAQEAVPSLLPGDIPGARIDRAAGYNGKALYGYIDGGAELYFEYGFQRASVQDIVKDSLRVHLELFEMNSPDGAAGIYSVTNSGCSREGNPWSFTCASPFQAQAARSRYFIRAANVSGIPRDSALTRRILGVMMAKVGDVIFPPPLLFLDPLFQRGRRTFMMARGPLGVQNGPDEWTALVEGIEEYQLSVLVQEAERFTGKIAILECRSGSGKSAANRWMQSAPKGVRRSVVADGPHRTYLCETNADKRTAVQYRRTLELYRREVH